MKIKKKNISMLLAMVLSVFILSACNAESSVVSSSSVTDDMQGPSRQNASVAVSSSSEDLKQRRNPKTRNKQKILLSPTDRLLYI